MPKAWGSRRSSSTLPAPATVGDVLERLRALPGGDACLPSHCVRGTWRTPTRRSRAEATRSPSCHRSRAADHGLPQRHSDRPAVAARRGVLAGARRRGVVPGPVRNHHEGRGGAAAGVFRVRSDGGSGMRPRSWRRPNPLAVAVALRHRVGSLAIGDVAVAVAAAARAPRRGVRGLPLRDRGGQAPGAGLEARALCGRHGRCGSTRPRQAAATPRCRSIACSSAARSGTSGSASPTAATCAASTACRRRSTSGCRGSRSSRSRRSTAWRACSPGSASRKVRLTGGEPLLRHDLPELVGLLGRHAGLEDLALTTNGILLARHAEALRAAGLGRVTVSLDTLRPERMASFARSARHAEVLEGIDGGARGGLRVGEAQRGGDPRAQR